MHLPNYSDNYSESDLPYGLFRNGKRYLLAERIPGAGWATLDGTLIADAPFRAQWKPADGYAQTLWRSTTTWPCPN